MASWILSLLMSTAIGGNSDCSIVYFTASWCEPCKQVRPSLEQLQRDGWSIQAVDADQQPQLVQQFRVENLPTIVIFCRNQEVDRLVGAAPYERILERVKRAAARNESSAPRAQTAAPQAPSNQPIVRGQSPSLAAFPMLAAIGSEFPAAASPTLANQSSAPAPRNANPAINFVSSQTTPTLSIEQAIARAAAATVRIRVDEANTTAYGTGTIVDVRGQEALILTCGHLFRDMQPNSQLTIDLFPGTPQEINLPSELIDFKAEEEDIGLISFRIPVPIEPVPILARGEPLATGQPAFSFGCDHGQNPTRRDTQISNINRYVGADNIEIVGAPAVGRSGGGLFDVQGRLIGVCNAANVEDNEGIYAAADVVYSQIERLGLSELFNSQSAPPAALQTQLANTQLANTLSAPPSQGWLAEPPSQLTSPPVTQAPPRARQVICIVRDADGQDKVVTIDSPTSQLLHMIQQSSQE